MGKSGSLLARFVSNSQFRITQTNRVCPRQLLDAALLAPAVPHAAGRPGRGARCASVAMSGAAVDFTKGDFPLKGASGVAWGNAGSADSNTRDADNLTLTESTWASLEMHAMQALPNLR